MMDLVLNERSIGARDWATILFVVCFALLAINRSVFEARFTEFIKLAYSDKYTKIYKDSSNMLSWFTISLFIIQLISLSFLIHFLLSYYGVTERTDWIKYIQILTLAAFFILSKYLIEKIVAAAFKIEDFNEQFNLRKVNYRTYIGLLLLPVNLILYYNDPPEAFVLYIIAGIIVATAFFSYLVSLRAYQNLILSKLFYFILYLCALEIAPYYFMYYWFTNS